MKPVELTNIEFITHAFRCCAKDESPIVCGFPGDVAEAPPYFWAGGSAFPIPRFIHPVNNCYICISTFRRSPDGRFRRRLDSWSGLHLLLLDDIGTKINAKNVLLPPSLAVETSPKNYQYWYLLAQPERNRDRAEALINGLIDAGASDPGAGNLSRLGRLPRGINGKAKYMKHGKPFVQTVHVWKPSRRYAAAKVAETYGIDLSTTKPKQYIQGIAANISTHKLTAIRLCLTANPLPPRLLRTRLPRAAEMPGVTSGLSVRRTTIGNSHRICVVVRSQPRKCLTN